MFESAEIRHRVPKSKFAHSVPPLRSELLGAQYQLEPIVSRVFRRTGKRELDQAMERIRQGRLAACSSTSSHC